MTEKQQDLVARLRVEADEAGECFRVPAFLESWDLHKWRSVMREAADEIERLATNDQEIRNKAIDDACNTINRLSADGELEGCSSDFVLSFASDLVQSLKEG